MTQFNRRLASLTPAQRALLEKRLREKNLDLEAMARRAEERQSSPEVVAEPAAAQPIPIQDEAEHYPLSLDQERIFFLHQLNPTSPFYNIYSAELFRGRIDLARFNRGVNEVVRRHESLRSRFIVVDGRPVQVIDEPFTTNVPVVDLEGLEVAAARREADRQVQRLLETPFVLDRLPLFSALLIHLPERQLIWPIVFHHIVIDWISIHLFLTELVSLYNAYGEGRPSPLPELKIQYVDFAIWQRQLVESDALESQVEYWRRYLAEAPHVTELPIDRPRPAMLSGAGRRRPLDLRTEDSGALREMARRQGVTLFMLFLTLFKAQILRLTGQEKLLLGSPATSRNHPDLGELIGYLLYHLAFYTDLSGDPTFDEALKRVRRSTSDAFTNSEVPFARLVEIVQPERDRSRMPLTQLVFLYLNPQGLGAPDFPGLEKLPYTFDAENSKFDITLAIWERDEFDALWEYAPELFDASTIDRLGRTFVELTRGVLADPGRRLSQLPLVTDTERHQLLLEWNDTQPGAAVYPREASLQTLFEARVDQQPDATATVFDGRRLSYGALDCRANRLAHRLLALGAGAESRIGLSTRRSEDLLIGTLGIVKAGGAYVPLERSYPRQRLEFMIADAGVELVVSDAEEALAGARAVVRLDKDFGGKPHHAPPVTTRSQSLLYVIYTSGSTGRPKGVGIAHRGVVRLILGADYVSLGPRQRVSMVSNPSFDAVTFEIWGPLLTGATIVGLPPEDLLSPEVVEKRIRELGITVMWTTVALFNQIAHERPMAFGSLRFFGFGGEAGDPKTVRRVLSHAPPEQLVNFYGPTECTTFATWQPFAKLSSRATSLPIGRAIAGTRLYVLDSQLAPLPSGMPGEICLGGDGLARGYLGRAGRTARQFVPEALSTSPGERLYRTGDLARLRADGVVEFLGRFDDQVKVRGFRIELGEIEAHLGRLDGVREAVVMVRGAAHETKRLVAYVIPSDDHAEDFKAELRARLGHALPDYMVPQLFVVLDELPLSPNGKVDRAALGRQSLGQGVETASYVAPRSSAEETLARVWAEVLDVEKVGALDNFFELGGDSILSIQVVSRTRQAGWEVTPRDLFDCPNLAALSETARPLRVTAAAEAVTGPVPLTPIQRWFLDSEPEAPEHFNQSVLLELGRLIRPARLEATLAVLVEHHDALRLAFHLDGRWHQVNKPPASLAAGVPLSSVDLTGLAENARQAAFERAAAQAQASLDLAGGLVRMVLFEGSSQRLLWVVHHLLVDGVSWRVLLEDLESVYTALEKARAISLPPRTTSFKFWAEELEAHAASDTLEDELDHWRAQTGGVPGVLAARPEADQGRAATAHTVEVALGTRETEALLRESHRAYRTRIDDVLLAALLLALTEGRAEEGLLLHLEGHGREQERFEGVDLSRTVGWFTSLYPVALSAPSSELGAVLKAVKETLRAVPGGGLGFGLLRYLGAHPGADDAAVSFNYLGQLDSLMRRETLFQPSEADAGPAIAPATRRAHLLDVVASVRGGQLKVGWTFSEDVLRLETIEALAGAYLTHLGELVAHCLDPENGGYAPADFPLAALNQAALDRFWSEDREIEDIYPLAPLQRGLLFHALREPRSGLYFECVEGDLRGRLDEDAFRRTFEELTARYEVFRTRFAWHGLDEPLQVVGRDVELPWRTRDERGREAEDIRRRLGEDRLAAIGHGFDLERAPLMALTLTRTGEDTWHFRWDYHHLLLDGWSLGTVLQDVFTSYARLSRGKTLPRAPRRPFSELVAWSGRQDKQEMEDFWRRNLSGFVEPTPISPPVSPEAGDKGPVEYDEMRLVLSHRLSAELGSLVARRRLTLSTLVHGAWSLLLAHATGARDLLFGTTVSGRSGDLPDMEAFVGPLINTLPVRVRLDWKQPLMAWLETFQAEQLELRRYEHTPLEEIGRWSDLPAGTPLFDHILVFENYPLDAGMIETVPELELTQIHIAERTNYPLTVLILPGEQLRVHLVWEQSLLERPELRRLEGQLRRLLEGLTGGDRRLEEIPLLSLAERHQLLAEWNVSSGEAPARPVPARFAAQAARHPGKTAVVVEAGGRVIDVTYGELDRRAERLARHLAGLGVGPEVKVGVCLDRGAEMLVALLAVWKAGGAWVPLDPAYPAERVAFMLDDALSGERTALVISDESRRSLFPAGSRLVSVDAVDNLVEVLPGAPVPDQLAYVLYTSGSTGRPKGVAIAHRGPAELVRWSEDVFPGEDLEGVLAATSVCFDLSIFELFVPLCRGGKVILVDNVLALRDRRDGQGADVTLINTVPSAMAELVGGGDLPASVRTVNLAGEPLKRALVERLHRALPQSRVLNLYGPRKTRPTRPTPCSCLAEAVRCAIFAPSHRSAVRWRRPGSWCSATTSPWYPTARRVSFAWEATA